jgi:hypothetical protein
MKNLFLVSVLALGALGYQEAYHSGNQVTFSPYSLAYRTQEAQAPKRPPTGVWDIVAIPHPTKQPFDVPPTEWDGPDQNWNISANDFNGGICGGDSMWDGKKEWCEKLIHHSVCVIPGTHNPDPERFPIADATGKTHCLRLAALAGPQ